MSTPSVNAGNSTENVYDEDSSFVLDHTGSDNADRCALNRPLFARSLTLNAEDKANGNVATSKRSFRRMPSNAGWQTRYYSPDDETGFNSKISTMKPGVISESLRAALGLSEEELPLYIYRMRRLGYPPGHLDEVCHRHHSGILIFDKDRQEVLSSGRVLEEGEVDEQDEVTYDFDQLIDFPGFNAKPIPGTRDEHMRLKFPPMAAKQSKEAMKQNLLLSGVGSKRRRSSIEISDYSKVFAEASENLHTNHLMNGFAGNDERFLEEKQTVWLSEMGLCAADGWRILDVFSEDENSASGDTSQTDHRLQNAFCQVTPTHHATKQSCIADSILDHCNTSTDESSSMCVESGDSLNASPKHFERYGVSVNVSSGTPIFRKNIYESKLPDACRFAAGLSEAIPYENSPDSTGAFQRMQKLLSEARSKI